MALRQYGRASRYNGFDRFEFDLRAYAALRFPYATLRLICIISYAMLRPRLCIYSTLLYDDLVYVYYSTEFSVMSK